MAFFLEQKVIKLNKNFLEGFGVILALVLFIIFKIRRHPFFTKHGYLLASMPVKHGKQGVAIPKVEVVNVGVLITLSPSLHGTSSI